MLTQQELHELNQAQEQINQRRAEMFGQSQRQSLKTNSANPGNLKATPTSTQCSAVKQPEPLNKVLAVIKSNEPEAAKYNPPAPVKCEYCGALRYTSGIVLKDHVLWAPTGPEACKCEKSQAAKAAAAEIRRAQEEAAAAAERAEQERERIKRIIGASGVGARFRNRTFDTFHVEEINAHAFHIAKGYADNFKALQSDPQGQEKNGLLINGPKGTGKTHLAAAIANQLMAQGVPVVFATMIDLLAKIKASFERHGADATENEIMRLYKTADLLIIDDIGKEQPTEWALAKIYQIINARYEDYKPMIITSNYTADELVRRMTPASGDPTTADATVDRILEMTYTVPLAGESWRTK